MIQNKKSLPPLDEIIGAARRVDDDSDACEHSRDSRLAEGVLRRLRQDRSADHPGSDTEVWASHFLSMSRWVALAACAMAIAAAIFAPEPPAPAEERNALSQLGGW